MVYAVEMSTIRASRRPRPPGLVGAVRSEAEGTITLTFVRRLRIYPHALREMNAYYHPGRRPLLFGYVPAASGLTRAEPAGRDDLYLPVAGPDRPDNRPSPLDGARR